MRLKRSVHLLKIIHIALLCFSILFTDAALCLSQSAQAQDQTSPTADNPDSQQEAIKKLLNPDTERQETQQPSAAPSGAKPEAASQLVDLRTDKTAAELAAIEVPVLKKMDVDKIGATAYYEEFQGLRLAKYFTVAQRVEIYEEPRSVDAYILDAKSMRILYNNQPWDTPVQFRSQIVPLFTRAYGTEITMSHPSDKEAQIRYTHDYRDTYNNYHPKYAYYADHFKHESWDQNEVLIMHRKRIPGIDWNYTLNAGYRYSTISAKNNVGRYEVRHTYFSDMSLAPNDRLEFFGQFEYFKSMKLKTSYDFRPDHYFGAGELRIRSEDMKTSFIPRFSYSIDKYYPFYDRFQKYEISFRVGRDFTEKFNASSTMKYALALRNEVDNTAPTYARPNPNNDMAASLGVENRAQYNIYDRLWLQAGVDYAAGMNMSDFDNWGILGGIEYYAPGLIRVDFGWRGNHYYNIDDFLSCLYFKFYLFM